MNLKNYWQKSLDLESYEKMLGENLALHQRHFEKYQLLEADKQNISKLEAINILVITEPFCGDSLALLPIVSKLVDCNDKWQMKIILRDKHPALIDQFLTNGGRAIPIFLFLDSQFNLLFSWGPRPEAAREIFESHRDLIKRGEIEKAVVIRKIRTYYAKDRGRGTTRELMRIINKNLEG